jgi:hypothetical protein
LQHQQLLRPLNDSKDAPTIVHLSDAEFPAQLVPFDILNGCNSGVFCQLEIVKKQAVPDVHAMKNIPVSNRDVESLGRFGDGQHGHFETIHEESTPSPLT